MMTETSTRGHSHGWLDALAIGASLVCAVHCLLTPVLVVLLPILTTTFWVSSDFHLWMILFVIPTTGLAIFMGCRKHKDKVVLAMSAVGVLLLVGATGYEAIFHQGAGVAEDAHCEICAAAAMAEAGHYSLLNATVLLNVLGGFLLASGHVRNFLLCRGAKCDHDHDHDHA